MSGPYQADEALVSRLQDDLVHQTIVSLEEMGGDSLLSGEDSGLKSVWEEVCVQVQHEESYSWDTYVAVIEDFLTTLVDDLPQNERMALWLSTDAGCDWLADNVADETDGAAPGVYTGDIVEVLKSDLLSIAADFQNSRIERYLRRQDGDDECDEDEDEDEGEDESQGARMKEMGDDEVPPFAHSMEVDIEGMVDEVLAKHCEGRNSVSAGPRSQSIDDVRSALDEQGKASLDAAIQALGELFGGRAGVSNAPLPAADPMTSVKTAYFIGWDVGGWNCDKNAKSRDAVVILDANRNIVGKPWRGNLRTTINSAADSQAFVGALFALCGAAKVSDAPATLAIDTPLGFSQEFVQLITDRNVVGTLGRSDTNPYLFRQTERQLFECGLKPLSAIKDMIGSQATKGMHVLARFAPTAIRCGAWQEGGLTAIEAYPSACKSSATVRALQEPFGALAHDDLDDALTCALVAYLFANQPKALLAPAPSVPVSEGWIWAPVDALPGSAPGLLLLED